MRTPSGLAAMTGLENIAGRTAQQANLRKLFASLSPGTIISNRSLKEFCRSLQRARIVIAIVLHGDKGCGDPCRGSGAMFDDTDD